MEKFRCCCGWHGTEYLQAPNPFDPEDTVSGCPQCKAVDTIDVACAVPECWEATCQGMMTDVGYKWLCRLHGSYYDRGKRR